MRLLSAAMRALLFLLLLLVVSSAQSQTDSLLLPTDDPCPTPSSSTSSCPVRCFRPDPVCGEGGVTYWCGCADAACNGARVAKTGFCQVRNGGEGLMSGQALLLVHIVWLVVLAFSIVFGLF